VLQKILQYNPFHQVLEYFVKASTTYKQSFFLNDVLVIQFKFF